MIIVNYCSIKDFNLLDKKNNIKEAVPAMNTKNIKNSCKLVI